MATTAKTVETELQTRLRIGTAAKAISDANLFDSMDKVQKTLNYALERKVTTGTLTTASGTTLYYCTTSIAADCLKVLTLYDSTRTIMRIPVWGSMVQYDRDWHKSTGSRVEAWSNVSHNMVAIYPGSSVNASAVYLQDTTTINSSDDTFNLADTDIDLVYDLCEIIWLTHLRLYPEAGHKVEQFKKTIAPYLGGQ